MHTKTCDICGRAEGSTKDRCGNEDGVPLGTVERCELCGRMACPDCEHEADCCFVDADNHAGEPDWAPPGWKVSGGGFVHDFRQWEREEELRPD